MLTLKKLLRLTKKIIGSDDYSLDNSIVWVNKAMEEWNRVCGYPECGRKFKTRHGLRIHQAKVHGWTNKLLKDTNPS